MDKPASVDIFVSDLTDGINIIRVYEPTTIGATAFRFVEFESSNGNPVVRAFEHPVKPAEIASAAQEISQQVSSTK